MMSISMDKMIPIENKINNIENTYKLKEACRQFEALFISQLLTEMEKGIPQDPIVKNNAANSIYKFMYINALSQKMAETSPFGIAKILFNSLKPYIEYKTHLPKNIENKPIKLHKNSFEFKPLKKKGFMDLSTDKMKMIKSIVKQASQKYHVPEKLVLSVIKAESDFNPEAISKAGAIGLMQLMPQTAVELGVKNIWDIRQNIMGGVKYLSKLLGEFKDYKKAIAAYNAGAGNVKKYNGIPPFRETQGYVKKVLAYMEQFH